MLTTYTRVLCCRMLQHQLRDAPLQRLRQPILFVRGTRDSFSDTGKFESVLPSIPSNRIEVGLLLKLPLHFA